MKRKNETNIEEEGEKALRKIQKYQEKQKKTFNEKHKIPKKFEVEEMVLVERDGGVTG